jgi:excisionase family DNA binding protein
VPVTPSRKTTPRPLLTQRQVAELLGITTRTLYAWVQAKSFPPPLRLGTATRPRLRWRSADVEAFIARQAKEAQHAR